MAQKRTNVGVEILEELIQSELAQSLRTVTLCNRGNMTYPQSELTARTGTQRTKKVGTTPLVMPPIPSPLKVLEIDGINPLGQFPALLCAWVRHFATSKVTTAIQANGYRMKMLYTCYEKAGRRFTCMSHTARGNTAEHTLHRGNCGDVRNMQQKTLSYVQNM